MVTKKMLRELTKLMAAHYVEKGYMYSGSAHPEGIARSLGIKDLDALYDLISAALAQGLIIERGAQAESYQLPAAAQLGARQHNLRVVWERDHHEFYPNDPSFGEIGHLFAEE